MILNRKQQPQYKSIDDINIPVPEKISLDNGIQTYIIKAGTQDIVKIDLSFKAGSWYQDKPVIATAVNEMLLEGTKSLTSQQIAEKLDFYGAFIHPNPTKDFANITLYTLKKYLPDTIKILEDIVKNPCFPEHELKTYINKKRQLFQVELEKVSSLARREFNAQLFGKDHPYGAYTELEDYSKVNQQDLVQFHKQFYSSNNCSIMVSGKVDENCIELINNHFGNADWGNELKTEAKKPILNDNPEMECIIEKANVNQSAIRLGKQIIAKDHPDYHKLSVVNTILGGYFGSRLMKVIREEKGYTYGISSVLVSLKHASYMVILSEVGADVAKDAIQDIKSEIKNLQENGISQEELNLVKNYLLGDLLRTFDGPFEISASFKNIIDLELDLNFYTKTIESVKTITTEEVKKLANKYLNENTLIKTIAGKYN